jgi:hypothetical protein
MFDTAAIILIFVVVRLVGDRRQVDHWRLIQVVICLILLYVAWVPHLKLLYEFWEPQLKSSLCGAGGCRALIEIGQ